MSKKRDTKDSTQQPPKRIRNIWAEDEAETKVEAAVKEQPAVEVAAPAQPEVAEAVVLPPEPEDSKPLKPAKKQKERKPYNEGAWAGLSPEAIKLKRRQSVGFNKLLALNAKRKQERLEKRLAAEAAANGLNLTVAGRPGLVAVPAPDSPENAPKGKIRRTSGYKSSDAKKAALKPENKHVAIATKEILKNIDKVAQGKVVTANVDTAYKEAQAVLFDTMNRIGLDAESMAFKLKNALEMALTTGRSVKVKNEKGEWIEVPLPDLRVVKDLLDLWGRWMRLGRPGGTAVTNAQFNLFGDAGLDEAGRQRVAGLVELLETEIKRRGLPDVRKVNTQPQDAEALPGVVDAGAGEEEAPD